MVHVQHHRVHKPGNIKKQKSIFEFVTIKHSVGRAPLAVFVKVQLILLLSVIYFVKHEESRAHRVRRRWTWF